MPPRLQWLVLLASIVGAKTSFGQQESIDFSRDVRPILSENCYACHGPDAAERQADLRFDLPNSAIEHGAITPGAPDDSEMLRRILSADKVEHMPPASTGKSVSPQQLEILKKWIAQGAKWQQHWSYVPPVPSDLPTVDKPGWTENPIDHFVFARLQSAELSPSLQADRATLIRRLSLDLTGLPPAPADVSRFVDDQSPNAYEVLVDRLLSSQAYGERMAQWWLDLARYADSHGYESDPVRSIWPYRDWVINAFNKNMPFDEFTIDQLAGDLLPEPSIDQRVATGFHRNSTLNFEAGIDIEEFRVASVVDRVNTTMTVWMGTTFGCAQCHTHKYDPISHKEYFEMFAFFNSTEEEVAAREDLGGAGRKFVGPFLELPTAKGVSKNRERKVAALESRIAELEASLTDSRDEQAAGFKLLELKEELMRIQPPTTMVTVERKEPRKTHVMLRGSFLTPGEEVSLDVPEVWNDFPDDAPRNRLGLAQWLVADENPLTARVTVNRLWALLFGQGIVKTSDDFGSQGDRATHPELLDYLAVEFQRDWNVKAIMKAMVMSATYRQSSRTTSELMEADPANELYSRGPTFRLDAEFIRDNALAISGLLCDKVGGPGVYPIQPNGIYLQTHTPIEWPTSAGQERFRRGIYTFWRRTAPYPSMVTFDATSRQVCTERRPRSNTPLQALVTLNDPAFVDFAAGLARRIVDEGGNDPRSRAAHGMQLCVSRPATEKEIDVLVKLYEDNFQVYRQDLTAAEKLAVRSGLPALSAESNLAELAAWTVVGNALLSLDETITKY